MKNATLCAVVMAVVLALPAAAKDVAGVQFPETLTVEGKELKLNGAGLRTKVVFKVYAAGLYLQNPTPSAQQVIGSDQVKRVRMSMLRDLEKKTDRRCHRGWLQEERGGQAAGAAAAAGHLHRGHPGPEEGRRAGADVRAGQGHHHREQGGQTISVEGKDFADALFSVWLGKNPVDGSLKDGMLGKD